MIKVNKKLILLLILMLIVSVGAGCGKASEPPEGVSQEFYDDMISCFKKLEKHKDNEEKNGKDTVQDYLDNEVWLSQKEKKIINAVDDMYFDVWFYYTAKEPNEHMVKNSIREVIDLMGIEINTKKLIIER